MTFFKELTKRHSGTENKSGWCELRGRSVFFVFFFFSCFFLSHCVSTEKPSHSFLKFPLSFQKKVFKNGFSLLWAKDHRAPVVSVQLWIQVGSADVWEGKTGIAEFLNKFWVNTSHHPFWKKLIAQGASMEAYTTKDYTVFSVRAPIKYLSQVLRNFSHFFQGLSLSEAVFQKERERFLGLQRWFFQKRPDKKFSNSLWEFAFYRHPYRYPRLGYPEDILTWRRSDIRLFYQMFYRTSNASLVVVGDVVKKTLLEKVSSLFQKFPFLRKPIRSYEKDPVPSSERRWVLRAAVKEESFQQAYRICKGSNPDTYALDVLSYILFEGKTARAQKKIVGQGFLKKLQAVAFTPKDSGLFLISGTLAEHVSLNQVEDLLEQEFDDVKTRGVRPWELKRAKGKLLLYFLNSMRSPFGFSQMLGLYEVMTGDVFQLKKDFLTYQRVTISDVQKVAQKYLDPNRRVVVIVAPFKKKVSF